MSNPAQWYAHNDAFLSAALEWLRLRLRRLARPEPSAAVEVVLTSGAPPEPSEGQGRFWGPRRGQAPRPAVPPAQTPPLQLPAPAEQVSDEQVAAARAAMDQAAVASDPPPALRLLAGRCGLSPFEQDLLLLCAAIEIDTRVAGLCARAQGDDGRAYPTFALAMALFDDPAWDVLSPERPLRYWRLIEISQPAGQPLTVSALRADERIVNYLKGLNYLDDRLAPLISPLDHVAADLAPSQLATVREIVGQVAGLLGRIGAPVVQLLGSDGPSKQQTAEAAGAALGAQLFRLSADLLPAQPAELESFARLWEREALLLPVALYLDAGRLDRSDAAAAAVSRFLGRGNTLCFLDTREHWPELGRPGLAIDIHKPTPEEQAALWVDQLGDGVADDVPARLAGQFNLGGAEIRQLAQAALAAPPAGLSLAERTWRACLLNARPRLDALAQRIDARATWDLLVLPEAELSLLRQVAAQVLARARVYDSWGFRRRMNRGLGISVLFAGDSGTGKTMAAEVIANDLQLNLYRIDLSAVVSKYIGETEKNLRKLFDAAEDGGTILFFDEADALFGKRSEVKDSHDRYANIEINYLLQRIESYDGLAILATNMKGALDDAFLRRLRFVINFGFPSSAERQTLWQKVFPPETPLHDVDYARLGQLSMTGGSIHNIALNAAFLAAQRGGAVTMPLIFEAARSELRKLERPINEAELIWP